MRKTLFVLLLASVSLFGLELQDYADVQKREMPKSLSDTTVLSYYDAIKDVKDLVVNISTERKVKAPQNPFQGNPLFKNNPFFEEFFGDAFRNMIPQERVERSLGSGVIITSDGYIITNNHVIDTADSIIVSIPGKTKEYKAKVIGKDPRSDVAVIKIEASNLKNASFANSADLKEGDVVFAIGNPFGVGETITQGIISALNKSGVGINEYENFIQTDAPINPGNSGGALVDSRGAVVGINTAIISRSGGNVGIGFAIPSNMAKKIATALITEGKIERGYMGVSIQDMSEDLKEFYNKDSGAVIASVADDSPAQNAGLKRGDLVIAVDGKPVKNAAELKNAIGSLAPNDNTKITFIRDRKQMSVMVKLGEIDSDKDSEFIQGESGEYDYKGAKFSQIDENIRAKFRLPPNMNGVIVSGIESDSKIQSLNVGDIVIQVEDSRVETLAEFKSAIAKYKKLPKKRFYINRRGRNLIAVVP
ncbi:MAG: Do family serine endopeptidase [Campylobacterales bacterium]